MTTLLHLVDVRIGFYRDELIGGSDNDFYQEVTLPELDRLLASIIVEEKRQEIKNTIIYQLMNFFDYQDYRHAFVEEAVMKDGNGEVIPASSWMPCLVKARRSTNIRARCSCSRCGRRS